jgi:hypothetical protein
MIFQNIILLVASIILVVSLVIIGVLINKRQSDVSYPPIVSECPDYFEVIGKNKCKNTHKLGRCKENGKIKNIYDFNTADFIGPSGKKNKCRLANFCNLSWDGIDKLC